MGQALKAERTTFAPVCAGTFENWKTVFTLELLRTHFFISMDAVSKGQQRKADSRLCSYLHLLNITMFQDCLRHFICINIFNIHNGN